MIRIIPSHATVYSMTRGLDPRHRSRIAVPAMGVQAIGGSVDIKSTPDELDTMQSENT